VMILGDICTRSCRFCSVVSGVARPIDHDEPNRVAQAVRELRLRHVVVTCVTRDDLPDGGAGHFCRTIEEIRRISDATVEVLPSDFAGNFGAVSQLINVSPDVYNYNTETVSRLYPTVRDRRANYSLTLDIFRWVRTKNPKIITKTGMMLGLGETREELVNTWEELVEAGCRMLTLGQYLQPSKDQMAVVRYVPPEEFYEFDQVARGIGFEQVASGPFIRSSYEAKEMFEEARQTILK